MDRLNDYGQWQLMALHALLVLLFAISFFQPRTRRDWRTFGAFSAFIIALFTEMYGFPLTIYLLSGWLSSRFPEVDWLSHNAGHLLQTILGWGDLSHFGPVHIVSDLMILGGFLLLAASWSILYRAQLKDELAVSGPYARVRHPQYAAFMLITAGFLVQWPTLATLVMFPILVSIYVRLAVREEKEVSAKFGQRYARYAENTPRFFPRLWKATEPLGHLGS